MTSLFTEQHTNKMPNSIQLEFNILGAIVNDNRLLDALSFLDETQFYSQQHSAIFSAMKALRESGEPITPFTVRLDESNSKLADEAGGVTRYLGSAMASGRLLMNPVEEARILTKLAQKRAFISSCQRYAESAANEFDQTSAEEYAALLGSDLEKIIRTGGVNDFVDDFTVTEAILEDLKDHRQPYSTGLRALDETMGGGLYPGRSYGFAARKKVGKTVLASTISCNLNLQGVKHLFICAEMSAKEIHQRNLSRLTDTYPSEFRNDHRNSSGFQQSIAEVAVASKRCILYHNAPGLTFSELKRIAASAVFSHGIKGLILDYWQLVGGKEGTGSTSEHLDEVAQWIADFGRKHGIWTITMAQINQQGNTRGGEGIRLAFDQVYQIRGMQSEDDPEAEDISVPARWLEMMDTRYTAWGNVGDATSAGLRMSDKGPFFYTPN